MIDNVILVDQNDNEIGSMPKMEAHLTGVLHRAFSIFIFNSRGELLLQQRALTKYHSGGKWTNTCCSHPRLGEETLDAAHRRLQEEMGMSCELIYAFNFMYKADLLDGLVEHEFDHVYFGVSDDQPNPNLNEVVNYSYITMDDLASAIDKDPDLYTVWLKICFSSVLERYHQILKDERSY